MSKKTDLQEKVRELGLEPGDSTIAQLEKIIADNAPVEVGEIEVVGEVEEVFPEVDGPVELPSLNPETVEAKPVPKQAAPEKPFLQKLEECVAKCVGYINKGGDEKEMKAYLKSISK